LLPDPVDLTLLNPFVAHYKHSRIVSFHGSWVRSRTQYNKIRLERCVGISDNSFFALQFRSETSISIGNARRSEPSSLIKVATGPATQDSKTIPMAALSPLTKAIVVFSAECAFIMSTRLLSYFEVEASFMRDQYRLPHDLVADL
jgi:hypothetical protein